MGSLTARLDEHRLSEDTIGLVCAFGEQERSTALVALLLVWSSRSSEQETPSSLSRVFHPSLERRLPSTYTPIRSPPISQPSAHIPW